MLRNTSIGSFKQGSVHFGGITGLDVDHSLSLPPIATYLIIVLWLNIGKRGSGVGENSYTILLLVNSLTSLQQRSLHFRSYLINKCGSSITMAVLVVLGLGSNKKQKSQESI